MSATEDRVAKMYFSKLQGSSAVTDCVGTVGARIIVFDVTILLLIPAQASCPETFRSFPQVCTGKGRCRTLQWLTALPQTPLSIAYSKHFYFISALLISFSVLRQVHGLFQSEFSR